MRLRLTSRTVSAGLEGRHMERPDMTAAPKVESAAGAKAGEGVAHRDMDGVRTPAGEEGGSSFTGNARGRVSFLTRFMTIWIFLAMVAGVAMGYAMPGLSGAINSFSVGTTSIPIAIGLIWMMYPPLARVRYEDLGRVFTARGSKAMLSTSMVMNWLVGTFLMFVLASLFLAGYPALRDGLILVGLARCIAMVVVWNNMADGDNEWAAVLVALNSVFQIILYGALAYFYITLASSWLFGHGAVVNVSFIQVAESVAIYLGIPFFGGMATRAYFLKAKGKQWYERVLMPRLAPTSLIALLFTIIVMFSLDGGDIIALPLDVIRVAIPLLMYYLIMFFSSFAIGIFLKMDYGRTATLSFTSASNNFELAIAIAISVFGLASLEAFATVIGPLIEVPVMISLVNVALWLRRRYFSPRASAAYDIGLDGVESRTMGSALALGWRI